MKGGTAGSRGGTFGIIWGGWMWMVAGGMAAVLGVGVARVAEGDGQGVRASADRPVAIEVQGRSGWMVQAWWLARLGLEDGARWQEDAMQGGVRLAEVLALPRLTEAEREAVEEVRTAWNAWVEEARIRGEDRLPLRRDRLEEIGAVMDPLGDQLRAACGRWIKAELSAGDRGDLDGRLGGGRGGLAGFRSEMWAAAVGVLVGLAGYAGWHWGGRGERGRCQREWEVEPGEAAELGTVAAGVVHELRHPLSAMRLAMASMRREGMPLGAKGEELEAEVRRMDRMLEDFLQAARPAVARLERLEAVGVLSEVGSLVRRVWQDRGVTIEVVEGTESLWMRADPALVRQILLNLVRNAAESMSAGGRVLLRARGGMESREGRARSVVMMEVDDRGQGIGQGAERGIFEPFASGKEGGTGLGLWMATRLAAVQGGHLEYRTETGKGTLFTLALPRWTEGMGEVGASLKQEEGVGA